MLLVRFPTKVFPWKGGNITFVSYFVVLEKKILELQPPIRFRLFNVLNN